MISTLISLLSLTFLIDFLDFVPADIRELERQVREQEDRRQALQETFTTLREEVGRGGAC